MRLDVMILVFWMLSFKPTFSLSSFTFIRRLFSSSSLSAMKNWFTGKDSDAWKDWRQEEKGTTEDEMVGWHHQLDGASSESWWWTGKPGVLQSMELQRVGHNWATEMKLNPCSSESPFPILPFSHSTFIFWYTIHFAHLLHVFKKFPRIFYYILFKNCGKIRVI